LLIKRATHLRDHAGEIGFPGGKPEASDESLKHTALREADEELGLKAPTFLGRLSSFPLYTSDYRLEPFVAAIDDNVTLRPDPGEVAEVLSLDIADIYQWSHIDAIPYDGGLSPVFPVRDNAILFGGSAHVFFELLEALVPVMTRPLPTLKPGRFPSVSYPLLTLPPRLSGYHSQLSVASKTKQ